MYFREGPPDGEVQVSTGTLEFISDPGRQGAWWVRVNGRQSSYVDLRHPTYLRYGYMQWLACALDIEVESLADPCVVHLGGGGCTLPLYMAAVHPGIRQNVVELDSEIVNIVCDVFDMRSVPGLQINSIDALAALRELDDASVEVIVRDTFQNGVVPSHLCDQEFAIEVWRVLSKNGLYVANIIDEAPFDRVESELHMRQSRWDTIAIVMADDDEFDGRQNVVLLAKAMPLGMRLATDLGQCATPARLLPDHKSWR